jgi:SAM-dependent methyltransferase
MTKPVVNLEGFKPKFERACSHLDSVDAIAKPLLLYKAPFERGQFGQEIYPVIYPSGLVMLNPRWTAKTFKLFYSKYYDELYNLALKSDYGKAGIVRNMQEVWSRITKKLNLEKLTMNSVLDAGCGPGYGLGYLKSLIPDINIFGIEASPDARYILENDVGATIIDSDIDGDWHGKHKDHFDMIILRHVVEHMLDPVKSLSNLRKTLSPQGYMYIAVPDMMHPRTVLRDYTDWWEYWFRAVHPYYYGKETLFATLSLAGLKPVFFEEENEEVWCIVKAINSENYNNENSSEDVFVKQMDVLNTLLP